MKPESEADEAAYRTFISDAGGRCWRCGRTDKQRPSWWHAEWHMHPHHFVNHPRKIDRRAVVALCPMCHGIQHGSVYPQDRRRQLTLAELMAIKKIKDPEYWDRAFIQTCSIRLIPRCATVSFAEYFDENGESSCGSSC